jgi:hypothetical protein
MTTMSSTNPRQSEYAQTLGNLSIENSQIQEGGGPVVDLDGEVKIWMER